MIDLYWLLIGTLTVWRLSHLLNAEDGPWDLLHKLRAATGTGLWGRLLDCFYCLSLWIALPVAWLLGTGLEQRLFLWPALSGGAILLERASRRDGAIPAPYVEGEPEP